MSKKVFSIAVTLTLILAGRAAFAQNLYFWSDGTTESSIHSAQWDGSNAQSIFGPNALVYPPYGPWIESVAVEPSQEKVYWLAWYGGESRIERSNFDGSDRELVYYFDLAGPYGPPSDLVLDPDAQRMYWIAGLGVYSANSDGSDIQHILATPLGETRGFAANFNEGWFFWISDGAVMRSRTDGSDLQTIIPSAGNYPYALEADPIRDRIYWTSIGDDLIYSARFDGSDVQILVTGVFACGLAIDASNSVMYWGEFSDDKIRKADLDGTNVQDVGLAYGPIGFALDVGTRAPALPAFSFGGYALASALLVLVGATIIATQTRQRRR